MCICLLEQYGLLQNLHNTFHKITTLVFAEYLQFTRGTLQFSIY